MVRPTVVLDASAALAIVQGEPGGDKAEAMARDGVISAVNFAEIVQRCIRNGRDVEKDLKRLEDLGMVVADVTAGLARRAGELERTTKPFGLSLADRMCLALALDLQLPVITSDKPFAELGLPLEVRRFR